MGMRVGRMSNALGHCEGGGGGNGWLMGVVERVSFFFVMAQLVAE